jgi:hypothetical protein
MYQSKDTESRARVRKISPSHPFGGFDRGALRRAISTHAARQLAPLRGSAPHGARYRYRSAFAEIRNNEIEWPIV